MLGDVEKTKYGYHKVMITLGGRASVEVKKIEDEINNYLDGYSIRILYGDKIYVKKKVSLPKKHAVKIKVVSVYLDGDKAYPQIWIS